jgi:flagellar biosynthesis/type III secretory pathway M-ring protein FliF/YscJ
MTILSIATNNPSLIVGNVFFYLFIALLFVFGFVTFLMMRRLSRKNSEMKKILQQHVAKIDMIRKESGETIEGMRAEMLKKEEDKKNNNHDENREAQRS